jgi:hypothetical protein
MKSLLLFGLGIMMTFSTNIYADKWIAEFAILDGSGRVGAVSGTTSVFSNQQECVHMNSTKCYSVNACGRTVWMTGYQDRTFSNYVMRDRNNAIGFRKNLYSKRFCVIISK